MRVAGFISVLATVSIAGCAPQVPDSGSGVGFGDYTEYQLQQLRREQALAARPDPNSITGAPLLAPNSPAQDGTRTTLATEDADAEPPMSAISPDALAAAGIGAIVPGETIEATPLEANNPSLSDEQDFEAVAERETIESDAERLERLAEAYQVVEPGTVPTRTGDTGPNIVAYALNAPNVLGQEWYSRFVLSGEGRFQRNCAKYRTPDEAQRDFLARGGPERDVLGLDPDGDGFACGWDPAPYRAAVSSQ